jgi:hypothetical protein
VRNTLACLTLVLAACSTAWAQKGSFDPPGVGPGFVASNGASWKGEVTKVDAAALQIELTYTKDGKTTTFNCVLFENLVRLKNSKPDEPVYERIVVEPFITGFKPEEREEIRALVASAALDPNQLLGRRVKVFYLRNKYKVPGQKEKVEKNEVFRVEVLKTR